MSISFSWLVRKNRKEAKVINGAAQLEVARVYSYEGGAHNLTLPTSGRYGDTIEIIGNGSGVYTIKQNAGQRISHLTSDTTTGTGGSLAAGTVRDCIILKCVSNDGSKWKTTNASGTFTVV